MKVAFVIGKRKAGGAEYQVELLKTYINEECTDHSAEIIEVNKLPSRVDILGESGSFLKRAFIRLLSSIKLSLYLKNQAYDCYVFYNVNFVFVALLLKPFKRVVLSIREYRECFFCGWRYKFISMVPSIYTNTKRVSDVFLERGIRVPLVRNYIPIEDFSSEVLNPENRVHPLFEQDGREFTSSLLMVCNVEEHKRISDVILACEGISIKIFVCGSVNNESYLAYCRHLATEKSVEIEFLGRQEKNVLYMLYRSCSVFVHASEIEGTSNALMEAYLLGSNVIASNIPENVDAVSDDVKFFDVGDVGHLRREIQDYLIGNNEKPSVKKRKIFIKEKFSRKNFKEIFEILEKCV